jgi:hypothetical protein
VRFLTILVLVAAFLGASDAVAQTNASPVAAYKARVNASCRMMTSVQLSHLRAMKSAIANGDQKTVASIYVAVIKDGAAGVRALVDMPVPASARGTMTPIWQLLRNALRAIDQGLSATTVDAFQSSMKKADTYGLRADPLLDAAGLTDCGSQQTRIIRQAAAKLGTGPVL